MKWTKENIDSQSGKTAIVTGANTGIGFEIAYALFEAGAHIVVTCRDTVKAEQAIERMQDKGGKGSLEIGVLDLASLQSVKEFALSFSKKHESLHLLINNAGVMMLPPGKTIEGFEQQFGINFLGHFALTGYLYKLLQNTRGARVVTLSSGAYKWVETIDFDNLRLEKAYDRVREYGTSKLADLLFTLELQRRIDKSGDDIISIAAHPGITKTDLTRHIPQEELKGLTAKYEMIMEPWQGALPALYAATSPEVEGGDYFGPDGDGELTGYPAPAIINDNAKNGVLGNKLWNFAENVTGLRFIKEKSPLIII